VEYSFSKHFLDQLAKRDLIEAEILETLRHPQQVVEQPPDRRVLQSIFNTDGKKYMIRVIVTSGRDPEVAITAYKTSKIDKYWK
jgi:uncharacterized membrane protein